MSVGFADKEPQYYAEQGYFCDKSTAGNVYIPLDKIEISGQVMIRYEKHPWIEKFEVDGVEILKPHRIGYGTKNIRAFVQSLNTIYAAAFDDYITFCKAKKAEADEATGAFGNNKDGFDAAGYFEHVAEYFVQEFEDEQRAKMFGKFCGFVENMWREGDKQSHDVAMNNILPIIRRNHELDAAFGERITEEFAEYIWKFSQKTV